jgi:hypothetical protein
VIKILKCEKLIDKMMKGEGRHSDENMSYGIV